MSLDWLWLPLYAYLLVQLSMATMCCAAAIVAMLTKDPDRRGAALAIVHDLRPRGLRLIKWRRG